MTAFRTRPSLNSLSSRTNAQPSGATGGGNQNGAFAVTGISSSDLEAARDFPFTAEDFSRIRALIYREAGISLSDQKRDMVYNRLARRLRALGIRSFSDYLDGLERSRDPQEWEAFTNALTTNLTAFFREGHHFPILSEFAAKHTSPLNVWCCAASTGEEPYSIAMTLAEAGGRQTQAKVLSTDIDTQALATASAGIYTADQVKGLPTGRLQRFFLRGTGSREGRVRVNDALRSMITFEQCNLIAPPWQQVQRQAPFDVIFCRNVMIYFDKPTQARILETFAPLIKPGGLLFAGHSENFSYMTSAFRLKGQTVYERTQEPASTSNLLAAGESRAAALAGSRR
ncbi:CheR family methyltransferase [Robbsia andropogonis]|uniref:CheR family methyltransferase n=1 Tax=Robbsia andropogonis TaxID=28092 RepID=UPI000465C8F4|nr:CheR family methyltransferase [Robbsia andropogonis]MCP1118736.1 chemotaxis protein CheR [Robbsia andropogonis]MCP1128203.1 chemotaxis protein CheR [Robbsia andropogonis]